MPIVDTGDISAFLGAHFLKKRHFVWVFSVVLQGG